MMLTYDSSTYHPAKRLAVGGVAAAVVERAALLDVVGGHGSALPGAAVGIRPHAHLAAEEEGEDGGAQPDRDRRQGGASGKRAAQVRDGLREQRDFVELAALPPAVPLVVKPLPLSATSLSLPPIQSAYLPSSLASSSSSMGGANPSASAQSAAAAALCPYPRATAHALFAGSHVPAGSFIAPLKGEVRDLAAHLADPIEQYALLGALKGGVRGLPAPWSAVLDQRRYGDEVRFARSGCHPNAVVRVVRLDEPSSAAAAPPPPPAKRGGGGRSRSATPFVAATPAPATNKSAPQWAAQLPGDPTASRFALALYALTDIPKRGEIILPWSWDDAHLAHMLPSLLSVSYTHLTLPTIYSV